MRLSTPAVNNATEDSTSARLDDGAFVLGRSLQVRERAAALQREARELVLTFRAHRFRPIVGASNTSGASDANGGEELRQRLGAFAASGLMKTYVGLSRGGTCGGCGSHIVVGDVEYDIVGEGREIRLDATCYVILADEVSRLKPEV